MTPTEEAGVLPVDKPAGPTSHDVVIAARRALRTRRIGHTGTLDPFASGLMLLCVGTATRIAQYLTGLPKTYRAVIRFGTATATDDRTGEPVAVSESWRSLNAPLVREALVTLTGDVMQIPPIFSAKKVGGVAMHRLARRGNAPVPQPTPVRIDRIELIDLDLPDATIEIDCSAGTYVRAVARDAGATLQTCA
ncbi:MAG: tRNA pseudouridine(55) synthase TruB, partial [Longimicrobiales bacterium]